MATTSPPVADLASDTAFFGHPRGLSTLFFTEMWERFAFYGMRAILILFMTASVATGGLGFDVSKAGAVYGTYVAVVYMLSLPGGWVADKLLGLRRSVLFGGVFIMCGQLCLAVPGASLFYVGLAFIVIGTGLLKPNVSAIVGDLYGKEDVRRDAGFSIFYMGINLGATAAPILVGWLAQSAAWKATLGQLGLRPENSWHWGFGVGAFGMLLGLIQYVHGWKYLGDAGVHPSVAPGSPEGDRARRQFWLGTGAIVVVIALVAWLTHQGTLSVVTVTNAFSWLYAVVVVAFFVWLFGFGEWTREERKRLVVILVLFIGASIFWSAFEQAASTLNLFANQNTRTVIFGWTFPPSWLQSVNAIMIICLAPVFAWIWVKLGRHDPSSPTKFAFGLLFVALGFLVMVFAAQATASGQQVSPMWLVVTYLFHTIGELCLSPVGLSAMTKLAPERVKGMMMGVWFLAASVGNLIAGRVAGFYESFSLTQLFGAVTLFVLVASVIMFALVIPIKRMLERE
ncbi:MAG TPA: peptide MFS transporter [Gemmatimonadales bacterium]|nr:peptide MFS transporter [Gemmatimonadales bacterium]